MCRQNPPRGGGPHVLAEWPRRPNAWMRCIISSGTQARGAERGRAVSGGVLTSHARAGALWRCRQRGGPEEMMVRVRDARAPGHRMGRTACLCPHLAAGRRVWRQARGAATTCGGQQRFDRSFLAGPGRRVVVARPLDSRPTVGWTARRRAHCGCAGARRNWTRLRACRAARAGFDARQCP